MIVSHERKRMAEKHPQILPLSQKDTESYSVSFLYGENPIVYRHLKPRVPVPPVKKKKI